MTKKRIEWIDYLKAFACFLVVLGHLLQSFRIPNITINTNVTEFIIFFVYLFHMPLFMCMSGFLYCKFSKINEFGEYKQFAKKKIINLLIPYITFYLLFLGISIIFSNEVSTPKGIKELVGIINAPMAPYWFLYSLLSIFLIVPIFETIFKHDNKMLISIFLCLKIISCFINCNLFFIDTFCKFSLYFYIGKFIKDNNENVNTAVRKRIINAVACIAYLVLAIFYYKFKNVDYTGFNNIIDTLFGVSGTILLINAFKMMKKSTILNTFKRYTFQVYLMHTIFAAGFRIILLKLGVNNFYIHFVVGLTASIYIPVIVSMISEKIVYTDFFFYPLNTIKKLKSRKKGS